MLKDNFCWHSSPAKSARGRTREMLQDKLLLAQFPCQERSRTDTRDAQARDSLPLPPIFTTRPI